jgi:hypothetical protein
MVQVPTGVISEFAHPPWGVLTQELVGTFTSSGNVHTLTRVRGPINVDAFGISWSVFTAPAAAGRKTRVVTVYEDDFLWLGVRYTNLSGNDFYGQVLEVHEDGLYFLWDQPIPTSIDIWVFPNFAVTMSWLVAL